jgi:hypothetical protein
MYLISETSISTVSVRFCRKYKVDNFAKSADFQVTELRKKIGFAFYVRVEWPATFLHHVLGKSAAEVTKGASIYLSN